MAQQTFTDKLSPALQEKLRAQLNEGDFEFRSQDHAHFSARGEGVVATLYKSGKLVVQGGPTEMFVERYLGGGGGKKVTSNEPSKKALSSRAVPLSSGPEIGGDESGKGDYFGPLCVAAIRLNPGDAEKLVEAGITDSKKVTDKVILRQAPILRENYAHALRILSPTEYNRRHTETGNVAILLSDLYRELVEELAVEGDHVIIDQFSKNESRLKNAMKGLGVKLSQMHRAEVHASVAAASFLAREAFLNGLKELSEEVAVDLPKGAGSPVLTAGREYVQIHGPDELGRVAKVHFKTTLKVLGRGGHSA